MGAEIESLTVLYLNEGTVALGPESEIGEIIRRKQTVQNSVMSDSGRKHGYYLNATDSPEPVEYGRDCPGDREEYLRET